MYKHLFVALFLADEDPNKKPLVRDQTQKRKGRHGRYALHH